VDASDRAVVGIIGDTRRWARGDGACRRRLSEQLWSSERAWLRARTWSSRTSRDSSSRVPPA